MRTTTLPILATAVAMGFAHGASAQTNATFLLTAWGTVSPSSPSTTIEIWAVWDDPANQYQFGGANYDITAGDGVFSDPTNVMNGPGSSAGVVHGNTVTGGANGQLFIGWFPPNGDNPILMASYTWTATDFTPRTVSLVSSNTNNFIVGQWSNRQMTQLFPSEFTPGMGGISVVPAPAAWIVLAASLAAGTRRRRA